VIRTYLTLQALALLAAAVASMATPQTSAAQQASQVSQQQRPRMHMKMVRKDFAATDNSGRNWAAAPPNRLYPLQAAFTQTYPTIGANSDGTDVWPCTGGASATTGPDPDCPTIGSPTILFPTLATAIGNPAFVWQLKNTPGSGNGQGCDALINGTGHLGVPYLPCGQVETWYEDDSNDSTDDLLYTMTVTQGDRTIASSGTVDYGPNPAAGTTPASDVIIYDPINFGFGPGDGPSTGPNNGNCTPDYNYPLTAPAFPGGVFLVAAGRTCVEPVQGPATITVVTALAEPVYTKVTGKACTANGVASPCYTVEYVKKQEICQSWDIWLE
jgi:hypothetical protein